MFSDGYDFKDIDDIVYEVDAANMVVQEGDVDIGANPSAEEQQEALENGGQTVINIVHSFRLQPTTFDKKSYLTYLKVRSARLLRFTCGYTDDTSLLSIF
jgi:hypothetical protein